MRPGRRNSCSDVGSAMDLRNNVFYMKCGQRGIGSMILILYVIVPTVQPPNFGRVYAAYGGGPRRQFFDSRESVG